MEDSRRIRRGDKLLHAFNAKHPAHPAQGDKFFALKE
jgi:hypothetical protein